MSKVQKCKVGSKEMTEIKNNFLSDCLHDSECGKIDCECDCHYPKSDHIKKHIIHTKEKPRKCNMSAWGF